MFYLLIFLISVSIFILYNWGHSISIWLHFALSPFIYGVSKFKINFFLVYFSLLSALAFFSWKIRSKRLLFWLKKLLFFLILAALLAGLLSFVFFIRHFNLPLEKYAYHFKGQQHSINYFAHIHTSKAPIFHLLNFLGLNALTRSYDTGLVFAEYVNPWIVLVLSFSVAGAFIIFLLLLNPLIQEWPPRQRWIIFVIYAFAGAHILKCLIDGGIFSYDLLPSLIALQLLFVSHDPPSLADSFKKRWLSYFIVIILYLGLCSLISFNEAFLQIPFGFSFMAALFLLLFLLLFIKNARSTKFIATGLICFLIVAFYWSMHGLSGIKTMNTRLEKGDRVLTFDYPSPSGPPVIAEHSKELTGKTILDAYRQLGENPLRNRRVAIIRPGEEKYTGFIFVLKIIKSTGDIKLESSRLMLINEISPFPKCGEKAYLLNISFNPNLIPPLWSKRISILNQNNEYCMLFFLNHYFLQNGIIEYAIIPYYFFNVGLPE